MGGENWGSFCLIGSQGPCKNPCPPPFQNGIHLTDPHALYTVLFFLATQLSFLVAQGHFKPFQMNGK